MIRAALLAAAVALPGVGPADPRAPVDVGAWPWSALVLVQAPGATRCTGFLVAPRTVATAAHCLYSARLGHFLPPSALHVLAGYRSGDFAAHVTVASFRVGDGYDPRHRAAEGADVAVLTLAAPLGGRVLALTDAAAGQAAMLGGYERDRAQMLLADRDCRVLGRVADSGGRALRQHSCAGTFGSSGAPLLVRGADGEWAAAGVQVVAISTDAGGLAVPSAALAVVMGSK